MPPYTPTHAVTENYLSGMRALGGGQVSEAIEILRAEPPASPCYSLALGNVGLALLRIERFQDAENELKLALEVLDRNGCPHPPSGVQFSRNLGEALVGQGRCAEALRIFNGVGHLADRLMVDHPAMAAEIELEKAHAFNSWGSALLHLGGYRAAIDVFRVARDIYQKHLALHPPGRAETLTNYAHALRLSGRDTEAELALKEAWTVAEEERHDEQVQRIQIALAQLGSNLVDPAKVCAMLEKAASDAQQQGRIGTAYVRLCICAELASQRGEYSFGLAVAGRAKALEQLLDGHEVNPAKLRMTSASLLDGSGAPCREIIRECVEGAFLWFARIAEPLASDDFATLTAGMHEHFRLLARALLDEGRVNEALLSFEAGRALAHGVEVDRGFLTRVVAANPFAKDGSAINDAALRSAQASLDEDQVLVTIAVLPPDLVAFVIDRHSVSAVPWPMPTDARAREELFVDVSAIASRLQESVGPRAIPEPIVEFARAIRHSIGERAVRALMPHSSLHDVPWRAVMRHVGIPWDRLRAAVEFGLLLRDGRTSTILPRKGVAVGYGTAGVAPALVDLGDEAREFARAFGASGSCVVPGRRDDVQAALKSNSIVLLSCHGVVSSFPGANEGRLSLQLADGNHSADEAFQGAVVAPAVILSACESGVYRMAWGDFPEGAAPSLLRAGARYCVGARFRLDARFSASFFRSLATKLAGGTQLETAFAEATAEHERLGFDLWRHLGCLELLGGP